VTPTPSGVTLEDCARRLGISRERAGFLERRALRKMRSIIEKDPKLAELFTDLASGRTL